MKSNLISKSETIKVFNELVKQWKIDIPKSKNFKIYHLDSEVQLIEGNNLKALKLNQEYVPFLTETQILSKFSSVTVDMGAVKFMCNGANVMRPGITSYTEFSKGDIVCVVEESQKKIIAVGKALVDSKELEGMKKGEVIKNLHYISDKYWEIGKTIFS